MTQTFNKDNMDINMNKKINMEMTYEHNITLTIKH